MYNIYNMNIIILYIILSSQHIVCQQQQEQLYNINVIKINSLIIDISIFILNITVGTYIARLL